MKKYNLTIILGLIGIACLVLYTLISIFSEKRIENKTLQSLSYNQYKLFYSLFKGLDYNIVKYYKRELPGKDGLIVYFDYNDKDKKLAKELTGWVKKGGTLFLAGINDSFNNSKVKEGNIGKFIINPKISTDVKSISIKRGKYFKKTAGGQNLIFSRNGSILHEKRSKKGKLYIFSDSMIFKNHNMANENIAVLMNNIFKLYYSKKIYLVHRHILSYRNISPVKIIFKGKLFYITIHVIIISILFIIIKSFRFGNPVSLDPFARRSLSEHITAVGELYRRSKYLNIVHEINHNYFIIKLKKILKIDKNISEGLLLKKVRSRVDINMNDVAGPIGKHKNNSESQLISSEIKREKVIASLKKLKK